MNEEQTSTSQELTIALTTLKSYQGDVQHADTKAANVSMLHLGAASMMATQTESLLSVWQQGSVLTGVAVVLIATFAAGFLVAGHHLAAALGAGTQGNGRRGSARIAFPFATDPQAMVREMRPVIAALANTAQAKHGRVRRAVPWTAAMLVSATLWTALSVVVN